MSRKVNRPSSQDVVEVNRTYPKEPVLSGPKTQMLPDLSASTQEILARVQAESAGSITDEAPILANDLMESTKSTEKSVPPGSLAKNAAQFQRPRMASGIFDKSKLKSAFASALIPKPKTGPSQPSNDSANQLSAVAGISTGKSSTVQSEKPSRSATELSRVGASSMKSDESTIEVLPSSAKSAQGDTNTAGVLSKQKPNVEKPETPKPKMRMSHTYVLPSGEIVNSGKGLGRGRPGIKRGPRKRKSMSSQPPSEAKPISRKRKRTSVESDLEQRSPSPLHSTSDSGDEITPQATQTRSGRHTQRPPAFVPPESPSHKKPRLSEPASSNAGKLPIKRKVYKGKEQSALCEHCLRGYGPLKNAIVFCDGCNRCWHQRCHSPMIPRKLVLDPNSEWFCTECTAIKQKPNKVVRAPKTERPPARVEEPTPTPLPSAESSKKDYFNSLSKEHLVDLLMQASTLAPHLPLWQFPPAPSPPQPSNAPTPNPASSTKEDAYPTPKNEVSDLEDDYDEYEDEIAKLYPRPGSGVQLPPESEDLHMLLEGPESRTFSHALREGIVGTGSGRVA
ncbi:hypothetical protein EPUS_04323 [Endocarpon pusillum Z07020]|uniref:PHD-type domain-containing protein n=1 Tax=Endocarpon pusillum (strain Z07020 / HMAS-L-300199) TaxID=1263415 RepID=U1GVY3_ENDPU|nr:uncharacterized protein EPUS_04323 [Endocarpon pusillum Z07020]ERF76246.1 hypothetical protein EPUS_04323 [Endocarpon pusillum Z07020]